MNAPVSDEDERSSRRLKRGRRPRPHRSHLAASVDEFVCGGMSVAEACRSLDVAPTTYYRWRRHDASEVEVDRNVDEETRQVVLTAAKAMFVEHGFNVSLAAIAKSAGVARQTIYNLCANKKGLFLDVLQTIYAGLLVLDYEPDGSEPLTEVLRLFGERYIKMALNDDALKVNRLAIAQYGKDPEVSRMIFELALRSSHIGLTTRVAAFLRKKQALGEVGLGETNLIAESFQSAVMGTVRLRGLAGVEQTTAQLDAHLSCTVKVFVRALVTNDSR